MAFKLKGNPMARNYGAPFETEDKYLDDKTNPKTKVRMTKTKTEKVPTTTKPSRPPRPIPKVEISDNFNPIGSNDKTMYDHLTTEGLQAPGPGIGVAETNADKRKKVRAAKKDAKAQANQNN